MHPFPSLFISPRRQHPQAHRRTHHQPLRNPSRPPVRSASNTPRSRRKHWRSRHSRAASRGWVDVARVYDADARTGDRGGEVDDVAGGKPEAGAQGAWRERGKGRVVVGAAVFWAVVRESRGKMSNVEGERMVDKG